ncbi:hypothetical protein EVG20_g2605 [Dentipellis fragilis]|uniref:Uncharacterized protein n=1 Tax=Dentipellis fragilis TaxID=205917 RepID=A0A4Y9Z8Q7_9AGAM|nr:hypothetical protein EVG20_g2605 [Dentipellis fragilis]
MLPAVFGRHPVTSPAFRQPLPPATATRPDPTPNPSTKHPSAHSVKRVSSRSQPVVLPIIYWHCSYHIPPVSRNSSVQFIQTPSPTDARLSFRCISCNLPLTTCPARSTSTTLRPAAYAYLHGKHFKQHAPFSGHLVPTAPQDLWSISGPPIARSGSIPRNSYLSLQRLPPRASLSPHHPADSDLSRTTVSIHAAVHGPWPARTAHGTPHACPVWTASRRKLLATKNAWITRTQALLNPSSGANAGATIIILLCGASMHTQTYVYYLTTRVQRYYYACVAPTQADHRSRVNGAIADGAAASRRLAQCSRSCD